MNDSQVSQYKWRFLQKRIHHFKTDSINNIDHMLISDTESSSVILSYL